MTNPKRRLTSDGLTFIPASSDFATFFENSGYAYSNESSNESFHDDLTPKPLVDLAAKDESSETSEELVKLPLIVNKAPEIIIKPKTPPKKEKIVQKPPPKDSDYISTDGEKENSESNYSYSNPPPVVVENNS